MVCISLFITCVQTSSLQNKVRCYFYKEMCIFKYLPPQAICMEIWEQQPLTWSDRNWPNKLSKAEYTQAGRMVLSYLLACAQDGKMTYKSMYTWCLCQVLYVMLWRNGYILICKAGKVSTSTQQQSPHLKIVLRYTTGLNRGVTMWHYLTCVIQKVR